MKQILVLVCTLLITITLYAQKIKPSDIPSLLNQQTSTVRTFLKAKGFSLITIEEGFYIYQTSGLDICTATIDFKKGKLNVISIQQSIAYDRMTLNALTTNGYKLTKSYPENDIAVPLPGAMYKFENDKLKIMCSVVFALDGYTFTTVFGNL